MELDNSDIEVYDDELGRERDSLDKDAHPLLFLFDTETTGLSIYEDHIVKIAAKVSLSAISQPSFSSLVHTPRNLPLKGIVQNKNAQKMSI